MAAAGIVAAAAAAVADMAHFEKVVAVVPAPLA